VYLVSQPLLSNSSIHRALKLFAPKNKIEQRRAAAGQSSGRYDFLNEISSMSAFTHQNLVKIIDAGEYEEARPYLVMEYIEGTTLEEMLTPDTPSYKVWQPRAEADPYLVIRMAQQIFWPLGYLHSQNFFHFDVAPKNIFVRDVNGKPHIVVGDVGVGRRLPQLREKELDSNETIHIAGTKRYTPPELLDRLNTSVPIRVLVQYAQYWDVYATTVVLLEMIKSWNLTARPELEATIILAERMKLSIEAFSAEQCADELGRLLPAHVLTAGVPELSTDASGGRFYVNIPLYPVPVSDRIREVIDHPTFTRLRRVPQLSLVRSIFPGGVHTRYEHALGSFALGIRALTKLLSRPHFRATFSAKELEEAMLSILLYSVTSFPFEHVFYEIYDSFDETDEGCSKSQLLDLFLADTHNGSVKSLFNVVEAGFPKADVRAAVGTIKRTGGSWSTQQDIISGLIKSSVDVRVMDYLVRDSYHTGIPAGLGVDVNHIIDNLQLTDDNKSIGVDRNAVFSVEHLLCARYWLFNRIYWNSHNRSITAMLRYAINALTKQGNVQPRMLVRGLSNQDESGALEQLKQWWRIGAGLRYSGMEIIDLLQQPRPRLYRTLLELSGRNWSREQIRACERLTWDELEELKDRFVDRCRAIPGHITISDVLFDLPKQGSLKLGEDVRVALYKGRTESLADVSDVVRVLPDAFHDTAVKLRIFYHPRLENAHRRLETEARAFLNDEFPNLGDGL
jgi:HD superfamily phosphohydrolase